MRNANIHLIKLYKETNWKCVNWVERRGKSEYTVFLCGSLSLPTVAEKSFAVHCEGNVEREMTEDELRERED